MTTTPKWHGKSGTEMSRIAKITEEQEAQIPHYIQKWVDRASGETNIAEADKAVEDMYADMGLSKPIILHFDSPMPCHLALAMLRDSQLDSQLWSQLDSQLVTIWWTVWAGFYDYAESIGVVFDQHKLDLFTRFTSNIGFCLPFQGIFIYSLKPTRIHWNNGRLHNTSGKAVEYADGWGWYALNGIPMEEWQVVTPAAELSLEKILSVEDIDQRRELVRRVGVERLASEGKELDRLGDYKLLDMRSVYKRNTPTLFLLMKNPSVPDTWHCEGVSSECKTVLDALNWRKPEAMKKIPVSNEGEDWYQQGDVCIWPADALILKELPCILT